MAGNAVIGALRVVLGADTAALDKGLKDSQSKLSSFGAGVAKAGAAAATAFVAAGAAIGVAVKGALNEADKLSKLSQKVGVPIEELSALQHAADLSGVSVDELGKALGKLSKNMLEAAAHPTSAAADAFSALGVSVTSADGKLKSSSDVLVDIAEKFEGLKDGAGKTAVSMALFGKAGADLIPLLNSGRDGIQELKDEAAKLGIVIDSKTGKAAEAFNDNLSRLGKAKDGIILKITAGLVPALEDLSRSAVATAKDTDGLRHIGEVVGGTLKVLATVAIGASTWIKQLGLDINALVEVAKKVGAGEFAAGWQSLKNWQQASKDLSAAGDQAIATLWGYGGAISNLNPLTLSAVQAAVGWTKAQKDFNYSALAGKTALDGFIESTQKSIAGQEAEIKAAGMAAGAKERLKIVQEGLQIATINQIPITDALRAKLTALGESAGQTALKMQGVQLIQQNLSPMVAYQQELQNTQVAMAAAGATADQIALALQRVSEKFQATGTQMAASVAGSLKTVTGAFGKEGSALATAAKAFAIVEATINAYRAASNAFATLPPPASYVAAAAAWAQAIGYVAGIKSTSVPSFKTGGSFTVPGGVGGGDSVRAMVDLQPGERVDIWRPGENGGNDPRRGGQSSAPLQVILQPRSPFERRYLEELVRGLQDLYRDRGEPYVLSVSKTRFA